MTCRKKREIEDTTYKYKHVFFLLFHHQRGKKEVDVVVVKRHKEMFCTIGLIFILYVSYRLYRHFFPTPNIDPRGKYVLISGCDTGFGNGLAIELDRKGFNVLAGVFLDSNVSILKAKLSQNATVFQLDITKQQSIDNVYDLIKNKTKVLHALVNNAGIGVSGYIDWTSMDLLRKVMEVNFFGHVAMTKKFLPLLIAKRNSRVVNLCSVAGYLASPSMSAYCASKYALESFSDCLRREMIPWDLRVSILEPGFMKTPIIEGIRQTFDEFWNGLSNEVQERWGQEYLRGHHTELEKNVLIKYAEDPVKVVRALEHAVANTAPKIRYRPGWQSGVVLFSLSMLPAGFFDWLLFKSYEARGIPASVQKQIQG